MVETYLSEELTELIHDSERNDEWKQKIESLGLEGQKNLLSAPDKSPVPFPIMNQSMQRVYETLCPNSVEIKEYSETTIPLRVLAMVALCQQENYFHKMMVWHDNKKPDPIIIGHLSDDWNSPKYLIARWGDELRSFPELKQLAVERKMEESATKIKKEINDRKGVLDSIQESVNEWMNGDWVQHI